METRRRITRVGRNRNHLLSVLLVLAWLVSNTNGQSPALRSVLIQIEFDKAADAELLYTQDLDIWQIRDNQAQILVNAEEMDVLAGLGYEWVVLNQDVRAPYRSKAKTESSQFGIRLQDHHHEWVFHSYDALIGNLRALADSPVAQVEVIGHSVEGRELLALKISDNPTVDEEEPDALVVSGVHAREWIGPEMTYHLAKHLVEQYDHDPAVRHIVDHSEVWILPVANPDGFIYSHTTDRYWRKNRRNNGGGTYGVDLNRNFGENWGRTGASRSPSSETYAGPAPFSEPETRAIRDLVQSQEFDIYLDYHSYGQLILYPFGYTETPTADELVHSALASRMAHMIQDVSNVVYDPRQAIDLYPTSGTTIDWVYAEFGIPSLLIELPGSDFVIPQWRIEPIVNENLPAALYYLAWGVGFGEVENLTSGRGYGQILPAVVDAKDGDEIVVGPGIYLENLTIADKHLVLTSADPFDPCVVADTVIQGHGRDATLTLSGHHSRTTELIGLTLTEGTLDAFNSGEAATILNTTITGADGVAVQHYHRDSTPSFIDSVLTGEINSFYRPGVVAHWALDEGSGSLAGDGFGDRHGTVFGNPEWQPEDAVFDGALRFDGVDDYIETPDVINPQFAFSVFLWVQGGAPGQVILSQADGSNWLLLDPQDGCLATEIKLEGRRPTGPLKSQTVIADGAWHRVGLVWDGAERSLYVDGVKVASETANKPRNLSGGLNIGCGQGREALSFWSGMMDELFLFRKAIVADQ